MEAIDLVGRGAATPVATPSGSQQRKEANGSAASGRAAHLFALGWLLSGAAHISFPPR
jgi:hypothetical protein